MAEQEVAKKGAGAKTSVKSYQQGIEAEKQKMGNYSKRFGTNVKALQADIKKHSKDISAAALKMREDGIKNMNKKVEEFNAEIQAQIKENKESVSHMANAVKFFISEIDKKTREFKSYVKVFWG